MLIGLDCCGRGWAVSSDGAAISRQCGLSFQQCFTEVMGVVQEGPIDGSKAD